MFNKIFKFLALILVVFPLFASTFVNQVKAASVNLISNPSVETSSNGQPIGWYKNSWGQNSATFTFQKSGQDGRRSLYVKIGSYASGDAKWYFEPINVDSGSSYIYSDYYKSSVKTQVVAQTEDVSGNFGYFEIGQLPVKNSWTKASFSFLVPPNAVKITIFHIVSSVGYLQTDNFVLKKASDQITITDNVPNNSVEQVSEINTTQPAAWSKNTWGVNNSSFTYLNNTGHTGNHSVKTQISSYTSGDAKWYYPSQPVTGGEKLKFIDYYQSNITSRVVVEVERSGGSLDYIELKNAPTSSTWGKYVDSFTVPADATKVTVFHLISAVGFLITDDFSVLPYTPEGFSRALATLTFDDGWQSQYDTALPMLQTHNFNATYYITTGFLDTPGYMSMTMVNGLVNSGNQIGAHTISHPHLLSLSDSDLHTELADSQLALQSNFSIDANDFASPYGEVDQRVLSEIQNLYISHRGVISGYNTKDAFDVYNLKVQNILLTTPDSEVQSWIDEAKKYNLWLILVYHQVDNGGDTYSVTPENFASQLSLFNQNGITIVTLDQALSEIIPQVNNQ